MLVNWSFHLITRTNRIQQRTGVSVLTRCRKNVWESIIIIYESINFFLKWLFTFNLPMYIPMYITYKVQLSSLGWRFGSGRTWKWVVSRKYNKSGAFDYVKNIFKIDVLVTFPGDTTKMAFFFVASFIPSFTENVLFRTYIYICIYFSSRYEINM